MPYLIDLRERKPGCTGHPVIRLNNELRKAKKHDLIRIIVREDDIPEKAITLTLKRFGYRAKEIKTKNGEIDIIAEKIP